MIHGGVGTRSGGVVSWVCGVACGLLGVHHEHAAGVLAPFTTDRTALR